MYTETAAVGCIGWYLFIQLVGTIGTIQIYRHYSKPPPAPISSNLDEEDVPHVTIIRPCTGIEPFLYECLAATFHQDYPAKKLTLSFCVSSRQDAAYPVLRRLLEDYPHQDAHIYVEEEDPNLNSEMGRDIGPNPKIRNMSNAYRQAKGDIIWILDCNIWVNQGACGRMVDKLCGFTPSSQQPRRPYKLVAHLPICVRVDNLLSHDDADERKEAFGGLLEQSFLSTAHAKMYVAINSVAVAPCINGKSTMFRRSHLNHLTRGSSPGIDFFGRNICEDHLIGDLLWKSYIPPTLLGQRPEDEQETQKSNPAKLKYKNHGLAMNDPAVQPIANMTVKSYIARRVRWLRVRKFTVPVATAVEPGTESILCTVMGAWGVTTSSFTRERFGQSWSSLLLWWTVGITAWWTIDYIVFNILQSGGSIEKPTSQPLPSSLTNETTKSSPNYNFKTLKTKPATLPPFVTPPPPSPLPTTTTKSPHLTPKTYLASYISREFLALPIHTWAIWAGTTVTWRNRNFWVGIDMKVHEVPTLAQPVELVKRAGESIVTEALELQNKMTVEKKDVDASVNAHDTKRTDANASANGHSYTFDHDHDHIVRRR